MKKDRQVCVEVQQRHQALDTEAMEEEVRVLKQKIEEEKKVSESIEEYLKTHYEVRKLHSLYRWFVIPFCL